MLAEMTQDQLAEWMAFADLEPFGSAAADFRAGIVASTIANTAFGTEKRTFVPSDFMPKWDAPKTRPLTMNERLFAQFLKMDAVEVKA